MTNHEQLHYAKILWDYHCKLDQLEHNHSQSTLIIGLGSYDLRVAKYCAQLYQQGYAQGIIFTGKDGNWTKDRWCKTEAEIFADCAIEHGVPQAAIYLEKNATNIGENLIYSQDVINQLNLPAKRLIIVTKPNTTRRAYATAHKLLSAFELQISAPNIEFNQLAEDQNTENLIHELVGDLERVIVYPAKGFQIKQEVPDQAMNAYLKLRDAGFTNHCIK